MYKHLDTAICLISSPNWANSRTQLREFKVNKPGQLDNPAQLDYSTLLYSTLLNWSASQLIATVMYN